jgi:hypothetical protein
MPTESVRWRWHTGCAPGPLLWFGLAHVVNVRGSDARLTAGTANACWPAHRLVRRGRPARRGAHATTQPYTASGGPAYGDVRVSRTNPHYDGATAGSAHLPAAIGLPHCVAGAEFGRKQVSHAGRKLRRDCPVFVDPAVGCDGAAIDLPPMVGAISGWLTTRASLERRASRALLSAGPIAIAGPLTAPRARSAPPARPGRWIYRAQDRLGGAV